MIIIDSYQASPLIPFDLSVSEFRNSRIKNVPTIRVFGSTLTGEKVCLHIHGVFPYIYVPYVGGDDPEDFAHRLAKALDYTINVSLGSAGSDTQHVYKIHQVKGVPFYGYHERLHHYFKIYFYNPSMTKRAAELLQNGSVLDQTLQPHEAHIPFILQFMIDYNIYGMSLINLKDVKYRQANRRGPDGKLRTESLTADYKTRDYLPPTVKRQSICEIEVDAWASDILNKEAIQKGLDVNPGLAAIWSEEKARRMLAGFEGGDSQLGPPKSPIRRNLPPTVNDLLQMQRFHRKLMFITQSEENSETFHSSGSSLYPVEIDDKFNLLDASHLERHVGPKNNKKIVNDLSTSSDTDLSLHFDQSEELRVSVEKSSAEEFQNATLDQSIFDIDDVPLVDILEQLAEKHNVDEQVDNDSILGSYCSAVTNDYKSDEDVEPEVPDLNLTALEIDNLSLNPNSTPSSGKSRLSLSPGNFNTEINKRNETKSQNSLNIPQFDGANDLPKKRNSSTERNTDSKKKRKIHKGKESSHCLNRRLNFPDSELKRSSSSESVSELDRTIVPNNDNFIISETSDSAENKNNDLTLVVEEKLICNYKGNKKNVIVSRKENLQSPKRTSKSPRKLLKSPSRRSPRKSLNSPRRNYSSLNIIVTPSKRRKELNKLSQEIPLNDDSSADAEDETHYFSQKNSRENTRKIEASNSKGSKNLSENYNIPGPSKKSPDSDEDLLFSPTPPEEKKKSQETNLKKPTSPAEEKETRETNFKKNNLNSQTEKNDKFVSKISLFRRSSLRKLNIEKSWINKTNSSSVSENNLNTRETEKKDSETFFSTETHESPVQKSQFEQISSQELNSREKKPDKVEKSKETKESLMDKSFFSQNILNKKSKSKKVEIIEINSEDNKSDVELFVTESSEEIPKEKRETSFQRRELESKETPNEMNSSFSGKYKKFKDEDLNKNIQSDDNWSFSQNSADDESSKGSFPLAQKPKLSSQTETNSSLELDKKSNISPLIEDEKIYQVETDSSDFEEDLEILLKNVSYSQNSENWNNLSTTEEKRKQLEEIIEDQNTSSDDTIVAEDFNLNIEEEINNQVCDVKKLLTVTFTEFTNQELNSTCRSRKSILSLDPNRLISITPRFSPPTREDILDTMNIYSIPSCRNQEPFYSNRNDIRQHKDTAHQIINKKDISEFPSFKSQIGGVVGIKLWRRMKVNEFHSFHGKLNSANIKKSLAERRLITVTPLYLPPDRKMVTNWIKSRKRSKRKDDKILEKSNKNNCESDKNQDNGKVDEGEEKIGADNVEGIKSGNENSENSENKEKDGLKVNQHLDFSSLAKELNISEGKSRDSISNDSSLCSTLRPSEIFTNRKKGDKNHRGVSIGQIDFSMDETKFETDVANQNLQNAKAITTYQYLTILCVETHITTRNDLLPDPRHDQIEAIFYVIHNDVPPDSKVKRLEQGAIIVDVNESGNLRGLYPECKITYVTCEADLFCNIISLISECNPDILIGWELETLSWGYIFQRAGYLGTNLPSTISRIPGSKCSWESHALDLEALAAEIKLPGRIVLDIWRIMRHEIALLSYTFENVMFHVMRKRLACPSFKTLAKWWFSKIPCLRWRVMDFYVKKNLGTLELLEQLDIIGRTCEHARLFGIQFFEVFSRGSQFRVESMMLRLAKPLNYILVSPSVRQRAAMRAPEALPLIMEPISTFYSDPVVVLDFQSLYPSIIIAYNYCFSTCLGRVEHLGQQDPFEFGCTTLKVTKKTALKLEGKINFSPVGIGFVKSEIRKGVLPRMLNEILNTRLMVKKAMKDHPKNDRPLQQVLHNRQLGLKLIANVTYGYTSANFSGRMSCIEVADSVVSKGKETLQRAIKMVEDTPKWGARVVYGDTDSLFILLHGKSRNEAFKIGAEIADAVTAANPTPVKLKFEKVLHPCILQTKKRYCGYSYETIDNEKPEYLAKGIETVRRDGCPASAKILEKTLKILFDTKDLSQVKQYVTRQLDKVFRGTVSIQDLTFAREFRGLRGYSKNACVPALELTRRLMKKDPRNVPRTSERVPYIIVAGAPNEALIHSVRSPKELLNDPSLRPNAIYYITRVIIPPLNRCLNLLGADVHIWFRDMPHREVLSKVSFLPNDRQKATISQFFSAHVCLSCGNSSESNVCKQCVEQSCRTIIILHEKLGCLEKNLFNVDVICRSCTGQLGIADCESLDCPVTYRRSQVEREFALVPTLRKIIDDWEI
ncbi:DNA polymerase zeta catalytic subunit isoform X2 [Leptopilina heterotoma]|uniref:DNA polymerase zeta catalytic subunit isoform X2 n=1 Tax=Leptopilina heterotoma TaxID=63436 RepID=UPI001CA8872F|nr:DNA polymerase zeta catalytic subunit isoform X2 [Leptopilina heterotoma]